MSDNQEDAIRNMEKAIGETKDRSLSIDVEQEPLPELRPDDYQDDFYPAEEEKFQKAQQKWQQEPLPESRPDDYEDGYLPGEENFSRPKKPVSQDKQSAEARFANSGTAFG